MPASSEKKLDSKTVSNLASRIYALDLNRQVEPEDKLAKTLELATDEVCHWVREKKITAWEELKKEVSEAEKRVQELDLDRFSRICTRQRMSFEEVHKFVEEVTKELQEMNIEEKIIVRILASNTWPHNERTRSDLARCASLSDLVQTIQETKRRIAEATTKKSSVSTESTNKPALNK